MPGEPYENVGVDSVELVSAFGIVHKSMTDMGDPAMKVRTGATPAKVDVNAIKSKLPSLTLKPIKGALKAVGKV